VTPEDVEAVFEERDDVAEPLTASEIGEALDCSRRTALNRLDELEASDAVESKKVGGRAKVWWVRKEREQVDFETDDLRGDPETTPGDVEADDAPEWEETLFPEIEIPGPTEYDDARRSTIRRMWDYLKEHGKAQKSDFKPIVESEETGTDFESFWEYCIREPGTLTKLPNVEPPTDRGHTYRYEEVGE
jgi:DNA-binding Lrp family transcriptional regulator